MKIYMATWLLEINQGKSLTACSKRERLLSYFHLLSIKDKLKHYIKTGLN
jgi:hypothetical protein